MIELTSGNINEVLNAEGALVIVDFWAVWCGPCRMMEPVLEELNSEVGEIVTIAKLNVDEYPDIAREYGVRNIPTMLFFKNGKIVDKSVGAVPKQVIQSKLDLLLL